MKGRFHFHLFDEWNSLALLPRLRVTTGPTVGVGFQWLTAWFHVWLWRREPFRGGHMIDVLPHVWLYWSKWGLVIHLWWFQWRPQWWIKRNAVNWHKQQVTKGAG